MTGYLLDTNVLIALLDPDQPFHDATAQWFFADRSRHWLSCPITENGTVRILSQQSYPRPQPIHGVFDTLLTLTGFGHHEHIPDDVSLLNESLNWQHIQGAGQITDTYLLLLAQSHDAGFATLDRRISTAAVKGPVEVFQIPN